MEQTIHDLLGLLIKAIPTVVLFILIFLYLKVMLFAPLKKVLAQRESLTAGARKEAEASLDAAHRKADEFEAKFNDARSELYKQQEELRKSWLEEQVKQVAEAHERSAAMIEATRDQLQKDAAAAREDLIKTSAALADEITNTILSRRAG
jgi:F-type H+-transporting ATPase subunit b